MGDEEQAAPAMALPFALAGPIETERLVMRPFEARDRARLAEMQRAPGIARYLYWEVPDDREIDERLEHKIASTLLVSDEDQLNLAVCWKGKAEMIADLVVVLQSIDHGGVELGYVVHPDASGQGVATEAVRALLGLIFLELGAHRVLGRIDARNEASAAVLRAAGLREEAWHRSNEFVKGEWTDERIFALLASEWGR